MFNKLELDENKNIKSPNSAWFLLKNNKLENEFNNYNLSEGDVLKIGRVLLKVKYIKFQKNENNNTTTIENKNNLNTSNNEKIYDENSENNLNILSLHKVENNEKLKVKKNILTINNDNQNTNNMEVLSIDVHNNISVSNNVSSSKNNDYVLTTNCSINTTIKDVNSPLSLISSPFKNLINPNQTRLPKSYKINNFKKANENTKFCRICYCEEEDGNPLLQPCICSGSMKYIHLNCLKHWLSTSSFIKISNNKKCEIYNYKTAECELCKSKLPDFIKHQGKIYEIIEYSKEFKNYIVFESLSLDKHHNKYLYVVSLDNENSIISVGRSRDSDMEINEVSVSRSHCLLKCDNKKKIFIQDKTSKFGTLILIQCPRLRLAEGTRLFLQIGRTYLSSIIKPSVSFFDCCQVSEKINYDFYFHQNKNIKNEFNEQVVVKTEEEDDDDNKEFLIKGIEDNNNENKSDFITLENGIDNKLNSIECACSPLPKLKIIAECDEENVGENKIEESKRRQLYENINLNSDNNRSIDIIQEMVDEQNNEENENLNGIQ